MGVRKRGEITFEDVVREIKRRSRGKAGAISFFVGTVREKGKKGGKVRFLEYEAYTEVVESQLKKIRDEVMREKGLVELLIYHIVGKVPVGEDTVYVAVAGEHRKESIEALREVMDRIKGEVSIWKKEVTEKGAYWVSP